jgi:hypothetical protein
MYAGDGGAASRCVGSADRVPQIIIEPKFGGGACPTLEQQRGCNNNTCMIDCKLSGTRVIRGPPVRLGP